MVHVPGFPQQELSLHSVQEFFSSRPVGGTSVLSQVSFFGNLFDVFVGLYLNLKLACFLNLNFFRNNGISRIYRYNLKAKIAKIYLLIFTLPSQCYMVLPGSLGLWRCTSTTYVGWQNSILRWYFSFDHGNCNLHFNDVHNCWKYFKDEVDYEFRELRQFGKFLTQVFFKLTNGESPSSCSL